MREIIKAKLIADIPEIQERCYEPQQVTSSTVKPYLVVRQGIEKETNSWSGFQRTFEVWPNVDSSAGTFVTVDSLAEKVNASLEKQLLGTAPQPRFSCFSLGTVGPDLVDTTSNLITRGLLFGVIGVQPVVVTDTEVNDSWLDVVAEWTKALPGTWNDYRNFWPLGYERPAVLWRIANIEAKNQNPGTFLVRKVLIGHVLGSTPNQQNAIVSELLQQLRYDTKLKISQVVGDKQHLTVEEVSGDFQADPINKGQITLIVSKFMVRKPETAPLIREVRDTGKIL